MIRKKFEAWFKIYESMMKIMKVPILDKDICYSIFEAGANAQLEIDQDDLRRLAKGE